MPLVPLYGWYRLTARKIPVEPVEVTGRVTLYGMVGPVVPNWVGEYVFTHTERPF